MSRVQVRRALLSVSDKTGLGELARRLVDAGVAIVSSGGTAEALHQEGVAVVSVSEVTGVDEMLGGRVKTLHPAIHGAILARPDRPEDRADLERNGIEPFQLVVVNLYPFAETRRRSGSDESELVEMIDIGGPALIRAAAKNHHHVAVATSPGQYPRIAAAVEGGGIDLELRKELAAEAFFHTASYDAEIVAWMGRDLVIPLRRVGDLRYGENPHQEAVLYREEGADPWWWRARLHQGKEMSFNNYADAEAAWRLAAALPGGVVIVKHTNPCGVAVAGEVADAFRRAWECDPLSAFGGVVAVNGVVDAATARLIADRFIEVVVSLGIEEEAVPILAAKKGLRLLTGPTPEDSDLDFRRLEQGFLVQHRDRVDGDAWRTVAGAEPDEETQAQLRLAWTVAAHTKSNAVAIARDRAAVGIGAGDQSRVGAAQRAVAKAGDRARGAVAASDAFFPFRDGVDVLADAGVVALVAPGGSRHDAEVVAAAEERGLTLVFTEKRHFRH